MWHSITHLVCEKYIQEHLPSSVIFPVFSIFCSQYKVLLFLSQINKQPANHQINRVIQRIKTSTNGAHLVQFSTDSVKKSSNREGGTILERVHYQAKPHINYVTCLQQFIATLVIDPSALVQKKFQVPLL